MCSRQRVAEKENFAKFHETFHERIVIDVDENMGEVEDELIGKVMPKFILRIKLWFYTVIYAYYQYYE